METGRQNVEIEKYSISTFCLFVLFFKFITKQPGQYQDRLKINCFVFNLPDKGINL